MQAFCDERIATCPVHKLRYNREEAACPDCTFEARKRPLPAAPRHRLGQKHFACPFCGGKSIRKERCTSHACIRAERQQRAPWNLCANCGGRTKRERFCTRYPCRQVAGTRNLYYRTAR